MRLARVDEGELNAEDGLLAVELGLLDDGAEGTADDALAEPILSARIPVAPAGTEFCSKRKAVLASYTVRRVSKPTFVSISPDSNL